ncbi:MAG: DciA family protein [Akkermansia sp.]
MTPSSDKNTPPPEGKKKVYSRRVWKTSAQLDREQALADWFEATPAESETSGIRPLETIISEVLATLPLDTPSVDPDILRQGWKAAAGDFIGSQAELISIVKGVATIHVLQPSMRYHLLQWKNALLEKLRDQFGQETVTSIRFRVG